MKRFVSGCAILILLVSLIACGGTPPASSQSLAPSSAPVVSSSNSGQPEDIEAVLTGQMEEIQNAVAPIAPKQPLQSESKREEVARQMAGAIAQLGLPVWQYHQDMLNYEQVTAFFEQIQKGGNAFVSIADFSIFEHVGINVTLYGKDNEGFHKTGAYLYQNDSFEWEKILYDRSPLDNLELTPNGNLLAGGSADFGDGMATGFRVIPQAKEYTDAYEKYVWLVDVQSDGVLSNAWNMESGFEELPWELIFEEIWERENKQTLIAEGNSYYTQVKTEYGDDYVAVVPADVVEGTLQKYFDVDVDTLHGMKSDIFYDPLYNSADNTYTIWGFRGGGYKPTLEVSGITDNPDGSITLDIMSVALDFGDDGYISGRLTVMPQPDGGFRYISNTFGDRNIRYKVEYALELAQSADMLCQGGFETLGESVEQDGYRFAAVDNDDLYEKISLGGTSDTESVTSWFYLIFEKSAADKYLKKIFDVPLYIDGEKDGEPVLFVNQDVTGTPVAAGSWSMEDFAIIESTPEKITVQMRLDTSEGTKPRKLTLVPDERRSWLLTDSYEGLQE